MRCAPTILFPLVMVAVSGITPAAHAGLLFSNLTGNSTSGGRGETRGTEFTVGASDVTVTSLGFYDINGDGLRMPFPVGIWRVSDEMRVGSVTVPGFGGGTLIEDWRFASVTPFDLTAGTAYRIAASGFDFYPVGGTATSSSLVSSVTPGSVNSSSSFSYPDTTEPTAYFWANAQISASSGSGPTPPSSVPEPTSLALLATGALGFMGYGWRRKRKLAA